MSINYNFTGKSVLITGGSRGIGRALIERLCECGAHVISISRTIESIQKLKKEKPNLNIEAIVCDISKWEELNSVVQLLSPVDFLVNNAAVAILTKFGEITCDEIDNSFNTNVKSIINISQIVTNIWKQRGIKGVIVNVSSQASQRAISDHTVYCATKAAVDAITRNMALELGPSGIRVNSVNPTAILTEMGKLYWQDKTRNDSLTSRIPLKRLGEVHEVVDVIMYLLSDGCTLVTGASVPVDGGFWSS